MIARTYKCIHVYHQCWLHLISVRLSDGSGPHEGRVEIYHDGEWGTVCNDLFNDLDATTVCWQLGYHRGTAMVNLEFGPGSGPIWLDNVECDGLSPEIGACAHNCWGCHDCGHFEDVGVSCSKYHSTIPLWDIETMCADHLFERYLSCHVRNEMICIRSWRTSHVPTWELFWCYVLRCFETRQMHIKIALSWAC